VPYDIGIKLKDTDVAKYLAILEPLLVDDEEIRGIFWANALKPMKNAMAITNGRLLGLSKADLGTPAKAVRDEVRAGEIAGCQVTRKRLGNAKLTLSLSDGQQRDYAHVQDDDADAIERHLAALAASGHALGASLEAQDQQGAAANSARSEAAMEGPRARLHRKANEALDANLDTGERVVVVITGASNQAVIGTDRRAFVYKKGFMAGATFGSEMTSWDYRNLVGVQLHAGMMSGSVVLQAPGQSGSKTSYWKQGDADPFKAPNAIPVSRPFDQAEKGVAELRRLIAQAHAPVQAPAAAPQPVSVAEEIAKLAELSSSGALTDEEFAAAKARLLGQ
jgi:hypothetical protein